MIGNLLKGNLLRAVAVLLFVAIILAVPNAAFQAYAQDQTVPISDLSASVNGDMVTLTWTPPTEAKTVTLRYSTSKSYSTIPVGKTKGITVDAAPDVNSYGITVRGLAAGKSYSFKLVVKGGSNEGESNIATVTMPGSDTTQSGDGQSKQEFATDSVSGNYDIYVLDNQGTGKKPPKATVVIYNKDGGVPLTKDDNFTIYADAQGSVKLGSGKTSVLDKKQEVPVYRTVIQINALSDEVKASGVYVSKKDESNLMTQPSGPYAPVKPTTNTGSVYVSGAMGKLKQQVTVSGLNSGDTVYIGDEKGSGGKGSVKSGATSVTISSKSNERLTRESPIFVSGAAYYGSADEQGYCVSTPQPASAPQKATDVTCATTLTAADAKAMAVKNARANKDAIVIYNLTPGAYVALYNNETAPEDKETLKNDFIKSGAVKAGRNYIAFDGVSLRDANNIWIQIIDTATDKFDKNNTNARVNLTGISAY